MNKKSSDKTNKFSTSSLITINQRHLNIVVTDDETFTRQSIIRILQNVSKELNLKLNIIEAEDGIETAYTICMAINRGFIISAIFSDENMKCLCGMKSSEIIKDMLNRRGIREIPFFLVTAYDKELIGNTYNSVTQIISKPITKETVRSIISTLN